MPIALSSSYVMPWLTESLESRMDSDTVTQMEGGVFLSGGWLFCKRHCGNVRFSWNSRCVSDMVKTLWCRTSACTIRFKIVYGFWWTVSSQTIKWERHCEQFEILIKKGSRGDDITEVITCKHTGCYSRSSGLLEVETCSDFLHSTLKSLCDLEPTVTWSNSPRTSRTQSQRDGRQKWGRE